MPKIIDPTENEETKQKVLTPIKLVSCLQRFPTKDIDSTKMNYFYKSEYLDTLNIADKIILCSRGCCLNSDGEKLDLIIVDGHVFLGFWNDGVI